MKRCTSCGLAKPPKEFQIRRRSADGRTASCRGCLSSRDKARADQPHRVAARQKTAIIRRNHPSKNAANNNHKIQWIKRNRLKRAAHIRVGNAIRDGDLVAPASCERCRKPSDLLHAHHEDYSLPLTVAWLCPPCHGARHRELNAP